jgi:hypothetical protein
MEFFFIKKQMSYEIHGPPLSLPFKSGFATHGYQARLDVKVMETMVFH